MGPGRRADRKDNTVEQMRNDGGRYKEVAVEMERKESFRKYICEIDWTLWLIE